MSEEAPTPNSALPGCVDNEVQPKAIEVVLAGRTQSLSNVENVDLDSSKNSAEGGSEPQSPMTRKRSRLASDGTVAIALGKGATDLNRREFAGAIVIVQEIVMDGVSSFDSDHVYVTEGDAVQFKWYRKHNLVEVDPTADVILPDGIRSGEPCEKGHVLIPAETEGERLFHCELDPTLRCRITVSARQSVLSRKILKYVAAALLLLGLVIGAIIYLAVWATSQDFLLPNSKAGEDDAYNGTKELRDTFITYCLPWFAFGVVVFLALIVVSIYHCFMTEYIKDFGRGFSLTQRRKIQLVQGILLAGLLSLNLTLWWLVLQTNHGLGNVFAIVSNSVTDSLNEVISVVGDLKFLTDNLYKLDSSIVIPASAKVLLNEVEDLASTVKTWSTHGDELLRALFRAISILMFLGMQAVMYSVAIGGAAVTLHRAPLMRVATRFLVAALIITSMSIGTTMVSRELFIRSHDTGSQFTDKTLTSSELQAATGMTSDSPVVKLVGACLPEGTLSIEFLSMLVEQGAGQFNNYLSGAGSSSPLAALKIEPADVGSMTLKTLANYSEYISVQLNSLDRILTNNPDSLSSLAPQLNNNTVPLLRTAVHVAKSLLRVLDCQVVRSTLGKALPVLKDEVIEVIDNQLYVQIGSFVVMIFAIVTSCVAAHVFNRPYKIWFEPRTGHWFMFRCSFMAHRRLVDRDGVASQKIEWRGGPRGILSAIMGVHVVNICNGFMMLIQGLLLILLNNSNEDNKLTSTIQAATFVILAYPFINYLVGSGAVTSTLGRFIVRLLALGAAVAAAVICFIFVADVSQQSVDCYNTIIESRKSNSTIPYPFTDNCGPDTVIADIERSVYLSFAGIVCLISAFTGMLLMCCIKVTKFGNADHIFEKRSPLQKYGKAVIGFVLIIGIIVGVVFIFHSTTNLGRNNPTFVQDRVGCNGRTEFCSQRLNTIAWTTTHNSYSTLDAGFVAPNHYHNMTVQLAAGVRGFMLDVHYDSTQPNSKEAYLCHQVCSIGKVTLESTLSSMRSFLNANTSEVVVIILEQYTDTADVQKSFDAANMTEMLWSPPNGTSPATSSIYSWPTLQTLVDTNKRVLVFTDVKPGTARNMSPPSWLMYVWDYMFETDYAAANVNDFSCGINRGNYQIQNNKWAIFNHFLTNPVAAPMLAVDANDVNVLKSRFDLCKTNWSGAVPSLVSIDFWSIEAPLRSVSELNSAILNEQKED